MSYSPNEVKELLSALRSERSNWESNWQETTEYVVPNKNNFTRTSTQGEKKGLDLFDSTAIHSNQLLAGALHGMLTNPSSFWFALSTGNSKIDQTDAVRIWLDNAMRKIHLVLNNANFQTEIHEIYLDLGSVGTALLYIEPDKVTKVRFAAQFLNHCYIMEDNKGMVDTVFRCFQWTLKQAVQEWGDKLPPKMLAEATDNPNKKQQFIHAVFPRKIYGRNRGPKEMPFASCYYVEQENEITMLSEKGYKTFPYAVPRWSKSSGETYGRSPAMNALPDIKMVNAMMRTTLEGAEKVVNPPLMAPDDGFVRKVRLTPAGVNYYRAGSTDRIEPLLTNARIDFGYQAVNDVRQRIQQAFFVDQLQLNQGPQMTATEVNQRTEEKLRLMGPLLGRQHSELLKPMIERIFDILQDAGEFGEPPDVLVNQNVSVNYTSAIAKVQMASEIVNIQRAVAAMGPIAQFAPDCLDIIDTDKTARFILDKSSVPQELIRSKKGIDGIRQGRAQAQEEANQEQSALTESEVAGNMAPAVKAISENVSRSVG